MAKSDQLRHIHDSMILNGKSKHEDEQIKEIVEVLIDDLQDEFRVNLAWEKKILLTDIINTLHDAFPDVDFAVPEKMTSFMTPDGGITYMIAKDGSAFPILIGEVKNQGTNDKRAREGLKRQAQGNAVERLGKNVIGFRTYMLQESIFPFVCFGDGCDFERGSSILDRVLTIAEFGALNTDHTYNVGPFNRGSYYFRDREWTAEEIYDILYDVAKKSIYYYFAKYGDDTFKEG